jgi:anthranilate/para-aminobenzoate synthase component II
MRVLLIDAYDSFVHIIDQYVRPTRWPRPGPTR